MRGSGKKTSNWSDASDPQMRDLQDEQPAVDPITIAVYNQKGGIGKTTANFNFGYILSQELGKRGHKMMRALQPLSEQNILNLLLCKIMTSCLLFLVT